MAQLNQESLNSHHITHYPAHWAHSFIYSFTRLVQLTLLFSCPVHLPQVICCSVTNEETKAQRHRNAIPCRVLVCWLLHLFQSIPNQTESNPFCLCASIKKEQRKIEMTSNENSRTCPKQYKSQDRKPNPNPNPNPDPEIHGE